MLALLGLLFFFFGADDLLIGKRIGVSLAYMHQRYRKTGEARNGFVEERAEEAIYAEGVFAGLGDHAFIAKQQVDAIAIIDEELEEAPFKGEPVNLGMKETLHTAITASFWGPSRDA